MDTILLFQGGDIDANDAVAPLDVVVRILNNQLSSLMWIDEKVSIYVVKYLLPDSLAICICIFISVWITCTDCSIFISRSLTSPDLVRLKSSLHVFISLLAKVLLQIVNRWVRNSGCPDSLILNCDLPVHFFGFLIFPLFSAS